MCGIAGWVGDFELEVEEVKNLLHHRGPDQAGYFQEGMLHLVHTRLSILDLSPLGRQPMSSKDNRYVIVFNGEIYNHPDLRVELHDLGYTFDSTSDTETLLYALIEWGIDCLTRLNGIFAFAFYDRQSARFLVARDQFGVKPLYYATTNSGFLFSSELKVVCNGLPAALPDGRALMNYICLLWSPGAISPEVSSKKLLPGHYLEVDLSSPSSLPKITKYYQIPYCGVYPLVEEWDTIRKVEKTLLQAVERQLLADVPVGFFLSGGLDSSLIVAMARKISGKRLQCFTIDAGFEEAAQEGFSDDLTYSRIVADELSLDLEVVKADFNIVRDFDRMIWHLDEPQADPAPLNVLNIARKAKEMGFKVLIGGTAADDLFTGYRRHQALRFEKYLRCIPGPMAKLLQSIPFSTIHPKQRRVKKIVQQIGLTTAARLSRYFEWLPQETAFSLFSSEWQAGLNSFRPTDFLLGKLNDIPDEESWVNRMLYWECTSFLPDHNLNYTDKMGMAEGVEIRVPYLDLEVVNLAAQIHPDLKLRGRETKYVLKKVAEKYLPREVIYRPKTGFGAPIRQWITGEMMPMIHERLSPDRIRQMGIFNPDTVWKLIRDNETGKVDASYSIWALLSIESWVRQFTSNLEKSDHSN